MSSSKPVCYAPLSSRVIWFDGNITPCCVFNGSIGSLAREDYVDKNSVSELISSLYKVGLEPSCQVCWDREKIDTFSSRSIYRKERHSLRWLEFNFSSLCHLKCRMCNSSFSSAWIREHQALKDMLRFIHESPGKVLKAFESDRELEKFLDKQDLESLEILIFKGGEPLLQGEVETTLKYFEKINKKNLTVRFNTSAQVPIESFEKFENFNIVQIDISIEGVGEDYRYIRGGAKYDEKNLERLIEKLSDYDNFIIESNSAISPYSYGNLHKLLKWLHLNIPNKQYKLGLGTIYPVTMPEYISYKAIPLPIREHLYEKNLKELESHELYIEHKEEIEKLFNSLFALDEEHCSEMEYKFVQYTNAVDSMRNESILDIVPEYKELFEKKG